MTRSSCDPYGWRISMPTGSSSTVMAAQRQRHPPSTRVALADHRPAPSLVARGTRTHARSRRQDRAGAAALRPRWSRLTSVSAKRARYPTGFPGGPLLLSLHPDVHDRLRCSWATDSGSESAVAPQRHLQKSSEAPVQCTAFTIFGFRASRRLFSLACQWLSPSRSALGREAARRSHRLVLPGLRKQDPRLREARDSGRENITAGAGARGLVNALKNRRPGADPLYLVKAVAEPAADLLGGSCGPPDRRTEPFAAARARPASKVLPCSRWQRSCSSCLASDRLSATVRRDASAAIVLRGSAVPVCAAPQGCPAIWSTNCRGRPLLAQTVGNGSDAESEVVWFFPVVPGRLCRSKSNCPSGRQRLQWITIYIPFGADADRWSVVK